jgi:hypothetical protein
MELTQAEADALIALPKVKESEEHYHYPIPGGRIAIPLVSVNRRENFFLDISRVQINLMKRTYQTRGRQVIALVRLDMGGSPHRNPDGEEVPCPHLHVYREGHGDKWAMPLPADRFADMTNFTVLLENFMTYCNVTEPPTIQFNVFQ